MKKIIYPAVIFCVIGLAACGGGSGGGGNDTVTPNTGGQPQNPNTAAKLVSSPQTIDYYGDSTIYGWKNQSEQVDITEPEAFAAALSNSVTHTVTNKGFSGQTSCELLNGTNLPSDWRTDMDQSTATVVILNHGINDAVSANGVPLDQYRSCLTDLARIAKAEGKRVIFETPNPIADNAALVPYVQAMRDVATAEGLSLIDQYTYLDQKYNGDAGLITRDGLHPRDEIYIEKGQYAASVFSNFTR